MIISLANEDKPRTPEHVDRIISAEIPDENTHVHKHRIVKKHMMHGPCGILNPSCVCMQDGKCKQKFPKDLTQQTEFNVNGYPLYRRRGQTTAQLRQHRLNDSWIVPHNLKLLLKFDCHMNVEVCTTVKSVKYIFTYIHEGNDMAHVEIREGHEEANARQDIVLDEIRQYLNSRYVGPHQAVYKLMQYEMHDKSHTIIRLAIHTWTTCSWPTSASTREKRMLIDPERFALRIILLHRKGATSFEDIRTVDGITHNTFKNAARAMSLLEDDAEHIRCLQDAVVFHLPAQMRQLFATLILFQTPNDIHALFTEFQEDMAEDYVRHATALKAVDHLLRDITKVEQPFGGEYFMLGGDFRQVLPVVKNAGRERVVQECLKSRKVEDLWSHFQQFRLNTNMRAVQDETYQAFSDWLLRIGNGVEPYNDQDQINLPQQICIKSLQDLMNSIYPQAESADAHLLLDPNTMSERCCLTPKNKFSHHINELILQRLPTPRKHYLSIDKVETDDPEEAAAYPMEFLNAQTPGGMPLHSLQ
eukprot:gene12604-biopygen10043